jgi:hypothetical protein
MIKHIVEVSQEPAYLSVRLDQLMLNNGDRVLASIPCEDIGVVVVDNPAAGYSHAALAALARSDAILVVCGHDHLPAAVLLPLADHSQITWRIADQVAVGRAASGSGSNWSRRRSAPRQPTSPPTGPPTPSCSTSPARSAPATPPTSKRRQPASIGGTGSRRWSFAAIPTRAA